MLRQLSASTGATISRHTIYRRPGQYGYVSANCQMCTIQLIAGAGYLGTENMLSGHLQSRVVCFLCVDPGFQCNQIYAVSSYGGH